MRVLLSIASLFLCSAARADCVWRNGRPWCTPGCWVVDTWWDGDLQWMRWTCLSSDALLAIFAVGAFALILILAAIGAAGARKSAISKATAEANQKAAEAQRITERLKAAQREADTFLKTYR